MPAVLLCCLFVLLGSSNAVAADSNRIIALEQDVRNLERLVASLEREVRALRQQRGSELPNLDGSNDQQELSSDARILLYAMEIGATGFLSGSVTFRDREVAAVEMPVLK